MVWMDIDLCDHAAMDRLRKRQGKGRTGRDRRAVKAFQSCLKLHRKCQKKLL